MSGVQLDTADLDRILTDVMRQAGPEGLTKDEIMRRCLLLHGEILQILIGADLYAEWQAGGVHMVLTEDNNVRWEKHKEADR